MTIEAKSRESAERICDALAVFDAELSGSDAEGYRVSVGVSDDDRQLTDVLDVLDWLPVELDARQANVSVAVASDAQGA